MLVRLARPQRDPYKNYQVPEDSGLETEEGGPSQTTTPGSPLLLASECSAESCLSETLRLLFQLAVQSGTAEKPSVILVDTSVWVDFLNSARGPAGDGLEQLISDNAPLVLRGLVVTEVLQGLKRDVAPITQFLVRWPLIEPDGFATYEMTAAVFRQARDRGMTPSTMGARLAAIALQRNTALFTLDRDFECLAFTGLRLHRFPAHRSDTPAG